MLVLAAGIVHAERSHVDLGLQRRRIQSYSFVNSASVNSNFCVSSQSWNSFICAVSTLQPCGSFSLCVAKKCRV